MRNVFALIAGLLFGFGLAFSGMTQPQKVISFLDVTGAWDPSLAFVMGGALMVFGPVYFLVRARRTKPMFATAFDLPVTIQITRRLIIGASIFGVGWGLAGFCPGTVIATLPTLTGAVLAVFGGLLLGILGTWGVQSALAHRQVTVEADF